MSSVEERDLNSSLLDAAQLPGAPKYRAYGPDQLEDIADRYGELAEPWARWTRAATAFA